MFLLRYFALLIAIKSLWTAWRCRTVKRCLSAAVNALKHYLYSLQHLLYSACNWQQWRCNQLELKKKANRYIRWVGAKLVTSLPGSFPRHIALRQQQLFLKKYRSGGEPLAIPYPIWPAKDPQLRDRARYCQTNLQAKTPKVVPCNFLKNQTWNNGVSYNFIRIFQQWWNENYKIRHWFPYF